MLTEHRNKVGAMAGRLGRWLLAATLCGALGSIIQTQINLHAIAALGAPVPPGVRLSATGADLLGFAPIWAVLCAVAFLPAFPVADWLAAKLPGRYVAPLHALAGGATVMVMLLVMEAVLPVMPVAAARTPLGMLAMALPGLAGGWLFARLKKNCTCR